MDQVDGVCRYFAVAIALCPPSEEGLPRPVLPLPETLCPPSNRERYRAGSVYLCPLSEEGVPRPVLFPPRREPKTLIPPSNRERYRAGLGSLLCLLSEEGLPRPVLLLPQPSTLNLLFFFFITLELRVE